MTTQTPEERLRAEWNQAFPPPMLLGQNQERVADWWLDKMNQEINAAVEADKERLFRTLVLWIAEYSYRKANPESKMDVPSIVYEQVEKDLKNSDVFISSK